MVPFPDTNGLLQPPPSPYLANSVADFRDLLNRILGTFKTQKAMADALKIDPSHLSKAINTGEFPFNVENCLRLAQISGEPPSDILRAANKGEVADLIESLYGPQKRVTDPALLGLIANWQRFSANEKQYVRVNLALLLRLRDIVLEQAAPLQHAAGPEDSIRQTNVSESQTPSPGPSTVARSSATQADIRSGMKGGGLTPSGDEGKADPVSLPPDSGDRGVRARLGLKAGTHEQKSAVDPPQKKPRAHRQSPTAAPRQTARAGVRVRKRPR